MAFRFRFASILQLRRQERDEAGSSVGQANEAIQRIDNQIDAIELERRSLREDSSQRVGNVSVDGLLVRGRYDLQLQAQLQSCRDTRSELTQELQRRQHALQMAEAEVKRFERLQEQDQEAYQSELNRREQAEADEVTSRRYTMQQRR